MWEKEKLLVMSNFSFSRIVFKRLVLQTRKNQGLFGKELTYLYDAQYKASHKNNNGSVKLLFRTQLYHCGIWKFLVICFSTGNATAVTACDLIYQRFDRIRQLNKDFLSSRGDDPRTIRIRWLKTVLHNFSI